MAKSTPRGGRGQPARAAAKSKKAATAEVGVAEEAPGAYKDVSAVVDAADRAQLARKVARLEPLVCVKG